MPPRLQVREGNRHKKLHRFSTVTDPCHGRVTRAISC